MEDYIKALRNMVDSSGRIVFFGGAGVSTESGIPDFRSENGIYDAIRPPFRRTSRDAAEP